MSVDDESPDGEISDFSTTVSPDGPARIEVWQNAGGLMLQLNGTGYGLGKGDRNIIINITASNPTDVRIRTKVIS